MQVILEELATMERTNKDDFNDVQAALFYAINKPMSLKDYCIISDYNKTATINFDKWIKKEGFAYDYATKANWTTVVKNSKRKKLKCSGKRKRKRKIHF